MTNTDPVFNKSDKEVGLNYSPVSLVSAPEKHETRGVVIFLEVDVIFRRIKLSGCR